MDIEFIKGNGKYSSLRCTRADGSFTVSKMPEQGIAPPHDMVHFVVEKHLNFTGAFYGQLKAGANISFAMEHKEASLALYDNEQTWQTEAMVEAIQSLFWSQAMPFEDFTYLTEKACQIRNVGSPDVTENQFNNMCSQLKLLSEQWSGLKQNQSIALTF